MTPDRPCLVALAERAELIRAREIRRCRTLRNDAQLLVLADQVSTSVMAALLRPIITYLAQHPDRDEAEQYVRQLFDLLDASEPGSRDTHEALAA